VYGCELDTDGWVGGASKGLGDIVSVGGGYIFIKEEVRVVAVKTSLVIDLRG
jgi:hypothetical protein